MERTLGQNISDLLNEQKMTQRELAEIVGVNEVSMSRYVNGARMPKGPVLVKIAEAMHTTSEELLNTDEKNEDFETAYYRIHRLIARYASQMTQKQKNALISAIVETGD